VIVEQGTHDNLLRAEGVYADLWAVQSGRADKVNNEQPDEVTSLQVESEREIQ